MTDRGIQTGTGSVRIAVTSGKGGTGKSMIAANLAFTLSLTRDVALVDCDVEEPDLHLFMPGPATTTDVTVPVPAVNEKICDRCRKCSEFCQYGAITVLTDRILHFADLCHGCGGCTLVCPRGAIHEEPKRIGTLAVSTPLPRLTLVSGILDIGNHHTVPVIRAAKRAAARDPLMICDTAPGTACPVVETLDGCDACILVTESTPFGLHDLRLAVDVAAGLGIPAGVVINRSDGRDQPTLAFCAERGLEVLLTIPFDREIAAIQNRGDLLCRVRPAWQKDFAALYDRCRALAGVKE